MKRKLTDKDQNQNQTKNVGHQILFASALRGLTAQKNPSLKKISLKNASNTPDSESRLSTKDGEDSTEKSSVRIRPNSDFLARYLNGIERTNLNNPGVPFMEDGDLSQEAFEEKLLRLKGIALIKDIAVKYGLQVKIIDPEDGSEEVVGGDPESPQAYLSANTIKRQLNRSQAWMDMEDSDLGINIVKVGGMQQSLENSEGKLADSDGGGQKKNIRETGSAEQLKQSLIEEAKIADDTRPKGILVKSNPTGVFAHAVAAVQKSRQS
mmetsp:Transcript_11574/g.15107  ORF Transcript_11574/g.15107 Transcript_11574/m.15107 type:complete len:266 (-) Transcript_11574:189-986(-)|eukprot:CAMPEP_0117754230 /NCGR_PEP_ID=MMETSP0947-20121206/12708_1 /TAXON_ID=44440 /ORGANISM="Chattonella subsalsa, Strain CCMP2191" /LENGTH=265 /DNA_ID=CAMNT_0005573285 /DNA_START=119 /DNA_END=916 /DNA_ORIENTATION=+